MKVLSLIVFLSAALFAGGLRLEITSKSPNTLTAKVVACKSPASSTVTATVLLPDGTSRPLKVAHADGSDLFLIEGGIPSSDSAVVQLRLSNPEFNDYVPRYLVRIEKGTPQLDTIQHLHK